MICNPLKTIILESRSLHNNKRILKTCIIVRSVAGDEAVGALYVLSDIIVWHASQIATPFLLTDVVQVPLHYVLER